MFIKLPLIFADANNKAYYLLQPLAKEECFIEITHKDGALELTNAPSFLFRLIKIIKFNRPFFVP